MQLIPSILNNHLFVQKDSSGKMNKMIGPCWYDILAN